MIRPRNVVPVLALVTLVAAPCLADQKKGGGAKTASKSTASASDAASTAPVYDTLLLGREELVQKLDALCVKLTTAEEGDSRDIAARMVEICHEAGLDWIVAADKDNRNGAGDRLNSRHGNAVGGDCRHVATNKIARQVRQAVIVIFRVALLDHDVLPVGESRIQQALTKRRQQLGEGLGRRAT